MGDIPGGSWFIFVETDFIKKTVSKISNLLFKEEE